MKNVSKKFTVIGLEFIKTQSNRMISVLIAITLFSSIDILASEELNKNSKISHTTSYVVFYDDVTKDNVYEIANYDMAILEPTGVSKELNQEIKAIKDTLLLGYMSTIEVESYDKQKVPKMLESDYLHINGDKVYIEKYDNYLGDIREKHFQDILIAAIDKRIVQMGFDGVFLDTVGYTTYFENEVLTDELIEGYITFLERLKQKYPELEILQNNGFEAFKRGSAKYIEGLMYEDFKSNKALTSEYYANLYNDIRLIAENEKVTILALSSVNEDINYEYAKKNHWLYYYATEENNYLELTGKIYPLVQVYENAPLNDVILTEKRTNEEVKKTQNIKLPIDEYKSMWMFLMTAKEVESNQLYEAIITDENGNYLTSYNQFILDITNSKYREYLIKKFGNNIAQGYLYFRLDYVTSIGKLFGAKSTNAEKQLNGYIDFLKVLKMKYNSITLVQTRGIDYLSDELANVIDGMYWNDFEFDKLETSHWLQEKTAQLRLYEEDYNWFIYLE